MANRAELMQRGIADPSVGIVTTTNADRKAINNEVRSRLQDVGVVAKESVQKLHFEDPKLTSAANTLVSQMQAAGVDRLGFGDDIPAVGVRRGDILEVRSFDAAKNEVTLLNSAGREIRINPSVQTDVSSYVTEQRQYAIGDRVVARSNIAKSRLEEADGHRIVKNGTAGVITAVDERGMTVRWTDGDGASRLTNQQVGHVDHAYSRTTFKSQGETTHRHIIAAHTGVHNFNRQDAYVAASRAKDQTEIVTTDYSTLLLNSTRAVDRVTAIDIASPAGLQAQADPHPGHRVVIGQLVSHGEARFRNNEDAQMSYQVRLKIEADKVITIWGSDLRRAVEEGKAAKGDMIVVQELGRDQAAGPRARVNWSIERLSDIQSLTELTKAAQTREKTAGRDIAPENAQQKERRTLEGELVSMGDAPYRNRAGAKQTFVVKVRDAQGKIREAWGSEAKKAVMDAGLQPGDQVRLRDLGKSDVMAQVPGSRDSVQRQRNVWSAERIEPVRAVQGEKSMEAAPEKDRAQQAPAKTERQIERPQVPDASAAPVQKLDQADEQSAQRQRSRGDGMSMG